MHALSPLRLALFLGALGLTFAAPPEGHASAAPPAAPTAKDRAKAADLKTQGDASMVALRYAEAIEAYSQAYAITEDPALLYNKGRALQGLERFPEALEQLEAFKAKASPKLKARVPALDSLIAEVRGKIAKLTIKSNVDGARILVRSKVVGSTPLSAPLAQNAGPAVVEVEADGYFRFKKSLNLPGGKEITIDATLSSKSDTGVLLVDSLTTGARVFIDGQSRGDIPVEVSLSAGSHTIEVEHEGFVTASTSAVVTAGDRKELTITLEKSRSLASRWWFWAGLGAVVAGGVVVTSALLIEKSPSVGTIPPGQVSAPFRY